MNIEKIIKNERMLRSVIGIGLKEFNEILPFFEESLKDYYRTIKEKRERQVGGGRKGALGDDKSKLIMILFYVKVYPTYDLMAFLYDVARGQPCYWVQKFLPVLEKALGRRVVLPERKVGNLEDLFKKHPEIKDLFTDGTERPINRPKKNKQQKRNYSGKKKRHTIKNTVIVSEDRTILFLGKTEEGKIHDKKLYDKEDLGKLEIDNYGDTGYIGGNNIITPKKGSKKNPLTDEEKETNKIISSFRVVAENGICGIKRFGIVSHKFRNRIYGDYNTVKMNIKDKVMLVSAGLHNLTIR